MRAVELIHDQRLCAAVGPMKLSGAQLAHDGLGDQEAQDSLEPLVAVEGGHGGPTEGEADTVVEQPVGLAEGDHGGENVGVAQVEGIRSSRA